MNLIEIKEFSGYFIGPDGNVYSNKTSHGLRPIAQRRIRKTGSCYTVQLIKDGEAWTRSVNKLMKQYWGS